MRVGKCEPCFRVDVCMISDSHQRFDCLGPFQSTEDRLEKFNIWYQKVYGWKTVISKNPFSWKS